MKQQWQTSLQTEQKLKIRFRFRDFKPYDEWEHTQSLKMFQQHGFE